MSTKMHANHRILPPAASFGWTHLAAAADPLRSTAIREIMIPMNRRGLSLTAIFIFASCAGAQVAAPNSKSPKEIVAIISKGDDEAQREMTEVMDNRSLSVRVAKAGIKSANNKEQLAALDLLLAMELKELIPSISNLMNSPIEEVRFKTLSVALIFPSKTSDQIIQAASVDKSDGIRAQALTARNVNSDVLKASTADKSPLVALAAANRSAYDGRTDPTWRNLARAHLGSKDLQVRAKAIKLLGYCGLAGDIPDIQKMTEERPTHPGIYLASSDAKRQIELMQLSPDDQIAYLRTQLRKSGNIPRHWALYELSRRHRQGDKHAIEIMKEISADKVHPGSAEAAMAINILNGK